jgi:mycothiol synthase
MTQTTLQIREWQPSDLTQELEVFNAAYPSDWRITLEQAKAWQAQERPEDQILRLLAFESDQAVGAGRVAHRAHDIPGRFEIAIAVRPESRRRGIGRALYERLLVYAREQDGREMECDVRETELAPVEGWLAREGFHEVSRMRESELKLSNFDPEAFNAAIQRTAAAGITFVTLAQQDSEENRRRLWQLSNLTTRDIPFDAPHPEWPFDRFQEGLESPQCLRDCLVIAKYNDDYIGFTILGQQTSDRAMTWSTGVHPNYRNRGIALALKVHSARLAKERGFVAMRTFNHVNNPAMLAVNMRLGYVPLPEVISFVKTLA